MVVNLFLKFTHALGDLHTDLAQILYVQRHAVRFHIQQDLNQGQLDIIKQALHPALFELRLQDAPQLQRGICISSRIGRNLGYRHLTHRDLLFTFADQFADLGHLPTQMGKRQRL